MVSNGSSAIESLVTYCLFQVGSIESNLVLDHNVMGWSSSSLKSLMRLEVEVPSLITVASDVTVYHSSGNGIVRALGRVARVDVGVFLARGIKARVVTLANNLTIY